MPRLDASVKKMVAVWFVVQRVACSLERENIIDVIFTLIILPHLPSTAPYAEYFPPISCDVGLLKHLSFPTKITSCHPCPTVPDPLSLLSPQSQVPPQHSLRQFHRYHADGPYVLALTVQL